MLARFSQSNAGFSFCHKKVFCKDENLKCYEIYIYNVSHQSFHLLIILSFCGFYAFDGLQYISTASLGVLGFLDLTSKGLFNLIVLRIYNKFQSLSELFYGYFHILKGRDCAYEFFLLNLTQTTVNWKEKILQLLLQFLLLLSSMLESM